MADKETEVLDENEELIVVMTDEEGNEYHYREELIIPVGEDKFALLVGIHDDCEDEDCECGCDCGCEDEEDVFIAKIVTNEQGEEEYIDPTDEEFEAVRKAYDALMEEEETE